MTVIDLLPHRLDMLLARLRGAYDGIGHSSGRPFVYFVHEPDQHRAVCRLALDTLRTDDALTFHHVDLLPLTIASLHGEEERRRELLIDPQAPGAAGDILRVWAADLCDDLEARLATGGTGRPVVVLRGLAALHPLSNPTALMESIAEQEPRDPRSGRIVPIVLLVPGFRPPQTSRQYRFLGPDSPILEFYRGEEI
ncbi:MAG: hypothetical protein ACRDGS_04770 [Chloroflexota bacterium]